MSATTSGLAAKRPYDDWLPKSIILLRDYNFQKFIADLIAGVTVGAAFVGACTSTLVIADILRLLHSGDNYSVISVDLRNPSGIHAVPNNAPGEYPTPAYSLAL
jgi:uncharacterized membrane protein